jgi:hypothetical protein
VAAIQSPGSRSAPVAGEVLARPKNHAIDLASFRRHRIADLRLHHDWGNLHPNQSTAAGAVRAISTTGRDFLELTT